MAGELARRRIAQIQEREAGPHDVVLRNRSWLRRHDRHSQPARAASARRRQERTLDAAPAVGCERGGSGELRDAVVIARAGAPDDLVSDRRDEPAKPAKAVHVAKHGCDRVVRERLV